MMITKDEAKIIIERIKSCIEHDSCEISTCEYFNKLDDLVKLEEYISNSSPVIRCIDCKWCFEENGKKIRRCGFNNKETFDLFFCYGGEQKDEQEPKI